MQNARILVAGGGIGGLTAALALLRKGFTVDVFEATKAFANIGAGVTLAPNAMVAYQHLGIGDTITARSMEPVRQIVRHWSDGRALITMERGNRMRETYG
ncbi:MAG: FAD-dependent monooxygenase, partial [Sphingobium sp.]